MRGSDTLKDSPHQETLRSSRFERGAMNADDALESGSGPVWAVKFPQEYQLLSTSPLDPPGRIAPPLPARAEVTMVAFSQVCEYVVGGSSVVHTMLSIEPW